MVAFLQALALCGLAVTAWSNSTRTSFSKSDDVILSQRAEGIITEVEEGGMASMVGDDSNEDHDVAEDEVNSTGHSSNGLKSSRRRKHRRRWLPGIRRRGGTHVIVGDNEHWGNVTESNMEEQDLAVEDETILDGDDSDEHDAMKEDAEGDQNITVQDNTTESDGEQDLTEGDGIALQNGDDSDEDEDEEQDGTAYRLRGNGSHLLESSRRRKSRRRWIAWTCRRRSCYDPF